MEELIICSNQLNHSRTGHFFSLEFHILYEPTNAFGFNPLGTEKYMKRQIVEIKI